MLGGGQAVRDDVEPALKTVVLLHGLARRAASMRRMAAALAAGGFRVCNIAYPSRRHSIHDLAERFVAPAIERACPDATEPIHFVTHSLGGIVVRQLAASGAVRSFGRVVMLAPPNQGSEVVDRLGSWWLFRAINGPAGTELGTSPDSTPRRLGPAPFELGIIAGNRSINWILSRMTPDENDGKVSVARAKLEGMRDFLVVPVPHPFVMRHPIVIEQTLQFLEHGAFKR